MAAPTTWGTPTSGDTVAASSSGLNLISYVGGYWFSITRGATAITIRYASDPAGAWTEATMPAVPTGYTSTQIPGDSGVVYGDGSWALMLQYSNGATTKHRIVHTTDVTTTWTAYEYDTGDLYKGRSMVYADSTWAICGQYASGSPYPGFIGYCSTVDGTYTFNTGTTAIGYDASVATLVKGIAHDGTTWVTIALRSGGADGIRYSTSLTSGWATPTAAAINNGSSTSFLRAHDNGTWTFSQYDYADNTYHGIFYATDPSDTWTLVPAYDEGFETTVDYPMVVGYAGGYWVMGGAEEYVSGDYEPRLAYASGATPTGTFTVITSPFTVPGFDTYVVGLWGAGDYLVAGNGAYGELRYCNLNPRPTYLRQRQSPVRSPSRVRPVQLRQRQTPIVTK